MPNWKARGSARKPSNLRVADPVAFNYYYAQVSQIGKVYVFTLLFGLCLLILEK